MIELEDRILERAIEAGESRRVSRSSVHTTYDVPRNVLQRLEELEILTPNARGYDADDVAIIAAISRFRAGGYEEAIGFTVYDTLRYREALQPLVRGGGRGPAAPAGRRGGRGRPRGRDHLLGRPAAARAGRGDALKAAAGRAASPARADRSLNGKAPAATIGATGDLGLRSGGNLVNRPLVGHLDRGGRGLRLGLASAAGSSGVSTSIAPSTADLPPHRVASAPAANPSWREDGEEDRPQHGDADPAAELLDRVQHARRRPGLGDR